MTTLNPPQPPPLDKSAAAVQAMLDKGIRAVKRGNAPLAKQALSEVLRADPVNESAWLWLSKVADNPVQKAECLRRVIALNPQNQWAVTELNTLLNTPPEELAAAMTQAETPASPSTPVIRPPSEIKAEGLSCPKCGGRIALRTNAAVTVACEYCQSVVDLSQEQAQIIGSMQSKTRPSLPIHLGMDATFQNTKFQVVGWMRLEGWDDEDRWRWEEWLLASAQGEYRWLSYSDDEGFMFQRKISLTSPVNRSDPFIQTATGPAAVSERAQARLTALAGELTWLAKVGEAYNYLEARSSKAHYTVEFSKTEVELFEGTPLPALEVWRAFGLKDQIKHAEAKEATRKDYRLLAIICGIGLMLGLCATLFTFIAGRRIVTKTVEVQKGAVEQAIGPIDVRVAGRPYHVAIKSLTGLPVNGWFVVDVALAEEEGNEFYLFSGEFWHETGSDAEGPWDEAEYNASYSFRPDEAGTYYIEVSAEEGTVDKVTVEVSVSGETWSSTYFILFTILSGLGAVSFGLFSASRV